MIQKGFIIGIEAIIVEFCNEKYIFAYYSFIW